MEMKGSERESQIQIQGVTGHQSQTGLKRIRSDDYQYLGMDNHGHMIQNGITQPLLGPEQALAYQLSVSFNNLVEKRDQVGEKEIVNQISCIGMN